MNDELISECFKSSINKFPYRCTSEKDEKCSILIYYEIDLSKIKNLMIEVDTDLLHKNNLVRLSQNYKLEKFLEENNLKMGDVDNSDDLTNENCVFFIKRVLSSKKSFDFFQKNFIKETKFVNRQSYLTYDNIAKFIDSNFMNCPKCKLKLSEINSEKNKHLYDCLIENGLFGYEIQQEFCVNLNRKYNRRKPSKVNRIINDNLSEKSLDNQDNKNDNCKSETNGNYLELKENLMSKEVFEKTYKKVNDTKRIKKNSNQELKSCPYCYKIYYKNEKKYNVHIAMCYENTNFKSVISKDFEKKKRITYKPFNYEPLDYEKVEKYL